MLITAFIILFLTIHYSIFLIRIFFGLLRLNKVSSPENLSEFVTVLIPFRNEEGKILDSLKSIESQEYPTDNYEVVYIDDHSTDNGADLLEANIKNKNISVLRLSGNNSARGHKKEAIKKGLEAAKGEIIVSTDSDCIHNPGWLKTMLGCFDNTTAFVSGPVEFIERKNFFSKFQRIEFAGLIFAGAGLIGAGMPTICNAANLAYRKKVFDEVKGFEGSEYLSSGDDEILMQKIASQTSYKVKFCTDPEAIAFTDSNGDINQFLNQRKRWASKGIYYQDKLLISRLILIFLFYVSLIVQPFLGFFISEFFFRTFFISFLLKVNLEFLIMWKGSEMLKMKRLLGVFIPAEILQIPYIIFTSISGLFGNYKWRGRELVR